MTRTIQKEGWMVRYGRRKIGRSFFHKRYFVLESLVLAYYKRKPSDQEVPLKSIAIDGNCRVDDRGLETHHGHAVYMLSVYSKKDRSHRITMGALNIQEACAWKEALEYVIDQYQNQHTSTGNMLISLEHKESVEPERTASSSGRESPYSQVEEDEDKDQISVPRNPNGSLDDWDGGVEPRWGPLEAEAAAASRRHWHLVRCQNGLRFFEEVADVDNNAQSQIRAMKVVGVIEATCAHIFELIMGMDETRYEWDCSFHHGSVVQEVDGHTAILHHCLQLDWFHMVLWPRDLCYVRYWRRNDDGSYVILFRSQEHPSCPPLPGCVRAHLENGGFTITPLKQRGALQVRARVEHLVQIDLRGWGANYIPLCHRSTVTQMLNSVAGLREWFAQRDVEQVSSPGQRIVKMESETLSGKKLRKRQTGLQPSTSLDNILAVRHLDLEESDDEDIVFHSLSDSKVWPHACSNKCCPSCTAITEEAINLSLFSGSLSKGAHDTGKNCWSIPENNSFRVRSKRFLVDKSKTPAGEPLMQLVAVDWFKDSNRIDHVARRKDCVAQVAAERGFFTLAFNVQVPATSHYSMVFYFVAPSAPQLGSLLQRFVDGDDNFRNSRFKLIPSVPKGSWIVRQSVGSTPCILGKAVDCTYHRGPKYLEVDIDIGSSTVANGVLGLVFGVITSLVVDMAFLVQGNSMDELPERLIGSVRVSHLELLSAISPSMENS
ncbi:unnamed protein product [Sphagnum jensenii]|uniref:START domain-containing protein n=1 Tax=Sphagnum jensenii TaxID=128206 RepID=A0ABP0VJK3_9BRYO